MALKYILDSLEGLSEDLQKEYKKDEKTGKFHLDVSDAVPKSKLDEFRNTNISLKSKIETVQAELDKFKDVDPEKYQEALKVLNDLEEKELIRKGDIEGVIASRLAAKDTEHKKQISQLTANNKSSEETVKSLRSQLGNLRLESSLTKALSDVAVPRKGAFEDILSRAGHTWKLNEAGDGFIPKGADGDTLYGADGTTELTMKEWANQLTESAPHLFEESAGSDSTGSGRVNVQQGQKKIKTGGGAEFGKDAFEAIAAGQVQVVS